MSVGKEHIGQMVWAAWPGSREVFRLELRGVTREEAVYDEFYGEWSEPGPWRAVFGKQYEGHGTPGTVHSPTCVLENVFLTEAEARKCIHDHCDNLARTLRANAEMWAKLAEEWK